MLLARIARNFHVGTVDIGAGVLHGNVVGGQELQPVNHELIKECVKIFAHSS